MTMTMWAVIILGVFVCVAIYLLFGLKTVQQQERAIVELFGKYYRTLKPGLNWILPGVMRVRAVCSIWEQIIPLFTEPVKIDFKDGSAVPKGTNVFVRIKSPDAKYDAGDGKNETGVYRSIYEMSNWRQATRDLIENALRSFLNGLGIDEAISMAKAGYDLIAGSAGGGLPNHEIDRIKKVLEGWGFELMRITITDFDLETEILKARGDVQRKEKEAEAATHDQEVRARQTIGTLIQMMAEARGKSIGEIRAEIDSDKKFRQKLMTFAQGLVTRKMSADSNALTDIRVEGGGDLEKVFARMIALFHGKR